MLHRSPEHFFHYVEAELGTETSIDGNRALVILGKFTQSKVESLIKSYIKEYVTCQMCRSFNTNLVRDKTSRLFFIKCGKCGSSRSVAGIEAGYHAQTKADRRAIRNAKI